MTKNILNLTLNFTVVLGVALLMNGCTTQPVRIENMANESFHAGINKVSFQSEGETLKGNLYLPENYKSGTKLPAIVVTGSWTTVKEQMAGLYAQKLANQGFAALAFDFRYFGESGGKPRQYESPKAKIADIKNAVSYLSSIPAVDSNRIGGLGICASSGYMAYAVAEDDRLKAYAAIAPWLHNAELVNLIYGGKKGVHEKIAAAKAAKSEFKKTGKVEYVPAISTTDPHAAMFGDFEYYLSPKRGAIPEWKNEFAVMSWEGWLTFDAVKIASSIKVPTLLVHSEQAAIPQGAKEFYEKLSAKKKIIWTDGNQFDFYDQAPQVTRASDEVVKHFKDVL